jgi:DNA-directed RNA polymerase specialized sigma24 family protein
MTVDEPATTERPPERHARHPDLTATEWQTLLCRLRGYARRLLFVYGAPSDRAEDIVGEALLKALDPASGRTWSPEKTNWQGFAFYLVKSVALNSVNKEIRQDALKYHFPKPAPHVTPEETIWSKEKLELLGCRLYPDRRATQVLEQYMALNFSVPRQSRALDLDTRAIYKARHTISCALKALDEDLEGQKAA